MGEKIIAKAAVVVLSATLLVFGSFGTAFAWNEIFTTGWKIHDVNPSYVSYLRGAYTMFGYYNADCYSEMNIACNVGSVQPGTITSQAALIIGTNSLTGGPGQYMSFGLSTTNWGGSSQNQYVTAVKEQSISQMGSIGEIGAVAWGRGTVRSNDGTNRDVEAGDYKLLVTTDFYGNYMSGSLVGRSSANFNPINLGSDNFIGSDGLVYGVAYIGDNGEIVAPDMARIKMENGEYGYISIDEMDKASANYATTSEELESTGVEILNLEAAAFQKAFADHFGIDALDYDAALECATESRYDKGEEKALEAMESNTREELAMAIRDQSPFSGKILKAIDQSELPSDASPESLVASDIAITEDTYRTILDSAISQLAVSIPAYAADGVTVIGEYKVSRL